MLNDIVNYLQLTEEIATSGQPTAEQITEIAQAGFQVVINLAVSDSPSALMNEASLVQQAGMEYIHIPVIWNAPSLANLTDFVATLKPRTEQKLFIHCIANMRVSVFVALYRIQQLGWTYERAMQDVHKIWTPNQTWQAFINLVLGKSL